MPRRCIMLMREQRSPLAMMQCACACRAGPFSMEIDGGIGAFKAARPAAVVLSSAGVERNAVIGDDLEARKKDIPIVQLNPGGAQSPAQCWQLILTNRLSSTYA